VDFLPADRPGKITGYIAPCISCISSNIHAFHYPAIAQITCYHPNHTLVLIVLAPRGSDGIKRYGHFFNNHGGSDVTSRASSAFDARGVSRGPFGHCGLPFVDIDIYHSHERYKKGLPVKMISTLHQPSNPPAFSSSCL
jgi:hypothetical protein